MCPTTGRSTGYSSAAVIAECLCWCWRPGKIKDKLCHSYQFKYFLLNTRGPPLNKASARWDLNSIQHVQHVLHFMHEIESVGDPLVLVFFALS